MERSRNFICAGATLAAWVLLAGCSSTIHKEVNIGGVHTLSIDAKQRLTVVGGRAEKTKHGEIDRRVTCTEASPDALVAQAASLAGNVAVKGAEGQGGGGLSASSSEAAASIGLRNSTIQILRDGYYRLCEVYMNGAISKDDFEHMALNVDTFMAVVSALQILGTNPITPAVAISASGTTARSNVVITATAADSNAAQSAAQSAAQAAESAKAAKTSETNAAESAKKAEDAAAKPGVDKPDTNAETTAAAVRARVVRNIVSAYLRYRQELDIMEMRVQARRAGRG